MREDDFEVYLRNTNLSENTIASMSKNREIHGILRNV